MTNVGAIDRIARLLAGAALLLAAALSLTGAGGPLTDLGPWAWALGAVGLVLAGTGMARICPAYLLFGVRTCDSGRR